MNNHTFAKRLLIGMMGIIITGNATFAAHAWFSSDISAKAPAIASFAKNESCGSVINFTESDFTQRTSSGAKLDGIVITSLPDTEHGTLLLGSREVLNYEGIVCNDIQNLRFVPSNGENLNCSFTFIPVFQGSSNSSSSATVTINLSQTAGTAPIAEDLIFETYKNVPICGKFKATDAEGGTLVYQIIDQPKFAEVVVENDGFRYTPAENKSGKDKFTYVATDSTGNTSDIATVTVKVHRRAQKAAVTYSDMTDSTVHYAAIKLSEMGIMKGEQIGSSCFFNPDSTMTRGEFVAVAVLAAGLDVPTVNISTGLYDDDAIPSWVKPYVSAALNAGLINGATDSEGHRVFLSDKLITRAEVAVILNNIAKVSAKGRQVSFTDSDDIPVWASEAVANLDAANIIIPDSTGSIRPCETICREEAAQMIFDTITLSEQKNSSLRYTWLNA